MTKLEQLSRLIIEAIHGLPYDEAIFQKEWRNDDRINEETTYSEVKATYKGLPITIGRVMQALNKIRHNYYGVTSAGFFIEYNTCDSLYDCINIDWKFTDNNGKELTLEDQSEETIEALLNLFIN